MLQEVRGKNKDRKCDRVINATDDRPMNILQSGISVFYTRSVNKKLY